MSPTIRSGRPASPVPLHAAATHTRCTTCALHGRCFPAEMTAGEVARFSPEIKRCRTVRAGEHLFRMGDPFHSLYAVRNGAFKTFAVDAGGREQVLNFNFPGEVLGLDAIWPTRHVSDAVALVDSAVCCLPFRALTELAGEMPALQLRLLRLVSRDLFSTSAMAGDYTAEERLAGFLVMVAARQGAPGDSIPDFIELPMCRQDIASYLRLATETVSRILARFQRNGLVRADRKRIELRDPDGLRDIAECMNPYARCQPPDRAERA